MIPVRLELENFLSFRKLATLDFSGWQLACVCGENGAGKSSLLDAITWALFGKCRAPGRDDVVNRRAAALGKAARVQFDFQLRGQTYRALRIQKPGRTGLLELQLAVADEQWRPLTEATLSRTQAQLEKLLQMNYEAFANVSFLLQGRADEFTVKRPGERKRILGDLLGVSHWEAYREAANHRRRESDRELARIDGRVTEVERELEKESAHRKWLRTAQETHAAANAQRNTQAQLVQSIQAFEAAVGQNRAILNTLSGSLTRAGATAKKLDETLATRQVEREAYLAILEKAESIEQKFAQWQAAATELKRLDEKSTAWNMLNRERQETQMVIEREKSRLEQELAGLEHRRKEASARQTAQKDTKTQFDQAALTVAALQQELAERDALRAHLGVLQTQIGAREGELLRLQKEMQALKARQVRLNEEESGRCPLCAQELTLEHRTTVIAQIKAQGEAQAEAYRSSLAELGEAQAGLSQIQSSLDALNRVERELRAAESSKTTTQTQLRDIERALTEWHAKGAPRLSAVESRLNEGSIAPEAQIRLAEFDAARKTLNYNSDIHMAARERVEKKAHAQREHQLLREAQATLRPLETSVKDLTRQVSEQRLQMDDLTAQVAAAKAKLEQLDPAPVVDLITAEGELNRLREAEVQAAKSVGAAEQALQSLDVLRQQGDQLSARRQEKTQVIRQLKKLERDFGRNGVQALLVEQALPAIQDGANELLDRLTASGMRVRFETQRTLKSSDVKAETLDIHIGDGMGERPYEMFSGGEAFRIDFAIRIALSQLLAQRAGARLQTLVIDEGFGSQDPEGRQGLLKAIKAVGTDFAKILVITHIEQISDAFPVRIEVTKHPGGSQVRVT